MKKNSMSKSGIFNQRIVLALALCCVGFSLAMLSLAAPPSAQKSTGQRGDTAPQPTVINSTFNAVSAAVRDLPVGAPTARTFENELPPIRPNRPVPTNFVD